MDANEVDVFQSGWISRLLDSPLLPGPIGSDETRQMYKRLGIRLRPGPIPETLEAHLPLGWTKTYCGSGPVFEVVDEHGQVMLNAVFKCTPYEIRGQLSLSGAARARVAGQRRRRTWSRWRFGT